MKIELVDGNTLAGVQEFDQVLRSAVDHARHMLTYVGAPIDSIGMKDTPRRLVNALIEMTGGYREDPQKILAVTFPDVIPDEMVLLKNIPFQSLCEHHIMPFQGKAHVAYLPVTGVVGLSKLARLVDCFAKRFQIQERMTMQIGEALMNFLHPKGVAVVVDAEHMCACARGVRKSGMSFTTSCMLGAFRESAKTREEFMQLIMG